MSHNDLLPSNNSVPVENVVVAESGDDSDDEWNYIKVDKDKLNQKLETPVGLGSDLEKEALKQAIDEDAVITSPTPPTASLGETDLINQESHAIAQALAEPEEACTELLEEREDSELFDLDRAKRSSSVAAEHDSELGNDQDLEEMDSQLNPDAKEFVPTSPQRTSVSSPFGNGLQNRIDLLDDVMLSQSPRKGSAAVMDDNDIELPAENDFTEISQRPSELVVNELNFENVKCENGNSDETKDIQRPGSSSSQCSYQEMNLKEAMHGDEKQELAAELLELENPFAGGDGDIPTTNGGQQFLTEKDPMNMSFYDDENNPFNSQEVDMNAVQPLPDDVEEEASPENEFVDYVLHPVALNNRNYSEMGDELVKELTSEAEKLNLNQENVEKYIEQPTPITNFVHELASEVTSILKSESEQINDMQQNILGFETSCQSEIKDETPEVINQSDLSVEANEFVPVDPVLDNIFEPIQSSDIIVPEPEPYVQTGTQELVQLEHSSNKFLNFGLPAALTEQKQNVEQTEHIEPVQHIEKVEEIEVPFAQEQPSEPAHDPEPEHQYQTQPEPFIESSVCEPVEAAAAVAATTAVAAAAVGIAKAATTKAKQTDTKKSDLKGKVAPIKKPTTTASKVTAKPTGTTAPKTTVAPKVAPRTVAPKVGSTVEKKTTTSALTRRPLSNGTGVTSTTVTKKTTTTSTVTKSAIGTARTSGIASKPATARTVGATTTATKAASKPLGTSTTAAPRVPSSARTVSKPTISTSTASKPTASRVKSAPVPSTVRSKTLTKPKTSTSTLDRASVTKSTVLKSSPTKTSSSTAAKSPAAKTSLGASSMTSRTTPTRKPLPTVSKSTVIKSPKVPTANGVASKIKVVAKSGAVDKDKVTMNGNSKVNGQIENGTGAENIIDVSAD